MEVVNLEDKFARFGDHWSPKIIAALNDYHIKAARLLGEFVWHRHDDTDELFLVTKGSLLIRFQDREVTLGPGDLLVVPKGVEHMPVAKEECEADRARRHPQYRRCRRRRARWHPSGSERRWRRRAAGLGRDGAERPLIKLPQIHSFKNSARLSSGDWSAEVVRLVATG